MGPTLMIHIPGTFSSDEEDSFFGWLSNSVYGIVRTGNRAGFNFGLGTCACSLALVPFGSESDGRGASVETMEEDHQTLLELVIGYRPRSTFQLDDHCRSDLRGHALLATLAAELATKHDGWIVAGKSVAALIGERDVKPRRKPKPGKWLHDPECGYLIDGGLMREWVRHPAFRLET